MKNNRRQPLLRYWGNRYLLTLLIGIIIIGILSVMIIRYNANQQRFKTLSVLAEDIALNTSRLGEHIMIDAALVWQMQRTIRVLELEGSVSVLITDNVGNILYTTLQVPPLQILRGISIPQGQQHSVQKIDLQPDLTYYTVNQAIMNGEKVLGYVIVLQPTKIVPRRTEDYQLLIIMLVGVALLGWLIIYSLTRNLVKPIKEVAGAAKQIVTGDYNLTLDKNPRELELFELVQSFQDMAEKLRQLETTRSEMLAGVTHELKTPVTAISGLLQAVRDKVVTGEEAEEFLEICSKETERLQKMVEDLLDYNSLTTGAIKVQKENHNLNKLVAEIIYQWQLGNEEKRVIFKTDFPEQAVNLDTDAMRLQQIIYNLLNNAVQSMREGDKGEIEIKLEVAEDNVKIDIRDNGPGIPPEEQELIFERYFRGAAKKDQVRGLGLGLSFSKMIARAMGGDLFLQNSSPQGSVFTIILNK
ncbi:MAG: HAMP domain-containing sensor histidine kinase [Peptococcia bacterium]